ncbi:hypothetical protein QTJ16_003956 [Diplocarpon rosae]|uniref:Uncharacterized protein n=1 Tax=Diplocarpon rosae TaxID=946125 RepID=A0AAD9SZT1_9HELO|nr:hypothetical protein QTJ16_003956 [Diplocarpon rosae]
MPPVKTPTNKRLRHQTLYLEASQDSNPKTTCKITQRLTAHTQSYGKLSYRLGGQRNFRVVEPIENGRSGESSREMAERCKAALEASDTTEIYTAALPSFRLQTRIGHYSPTTPK